MSSLNVSKPVALFVVFEDEKGHQHEAYISSAHITEVAMSEGRTYWTFASRGEWSIKKFNKRKKFKHTKETT